MRSIEMNRKAIHTLEDWNPFEMTDFTYDTEAADVVAALQYIDDPSELGKVIQNIYEQSFEQWIPIEKCIDISYKLLAIKFEAKCIL
ncbi:DUF1871 family protein [Rummeliibacillus suwonensis]|jgi:hypothetical protein|uniref:DUF1871 family protein n=1 Tax=Rummeliibacillus suwonensis TaxID=1306154 RepID=UPI0011B3A3BA|nr:DUF1871 family protein [Rummeliibacillus suwonensis]MBO2537501.1 DUF1871 family protein [Rummeliibacillus suwonensis]